MYIHVPYGLPRNECSIWKLVSIWNTTEIETQEDDTRTQKPIGHWPKGGRAAPEPSNKRGLTCTRSSGWDLHGPNHSQLVLNGSLPSCWESGSGLITQTFVSVMLTFFFFVVAKATVCALQVDVE